MEISGSRADVQTSPQNASSFPGSLTLQLSSGILSSKFTSFDSYVGVVWKIVGLSPNDPYQSRCLNDSLDTTKRYQKEIIQSGQLQTRINRTQWSCSWVSTSSFWITLTKPIISIIKFSKSNFCLLLHATTFNLPSCWFLLGMAQAASNLLLLSSPKVMGLIVFVELLVPDLGASHCHPLSKVVSLNPPRPAIFQVVPC